MRRSRAKQKGDWELYSQLGKELHQIPSMQTHDPNFRRLHYCRYADDFLLGYIGEKSEAETIKLQISDFLKGLDLQLSQEKTLITHAQSQNAHFLGYEISVSWENRKLTKSLKGIKARSINGNIQLRVPRSVSTKLVQKYSQKGKPHYIAWLQSFSDYEIVSTYGAQLRGLVNYYLLASNISQRLEAVYWACLQSCRKTLAKKHRLTRRESYKRYFWQEQGQRRHLRVVLERPEKKPLIARCGELSLKYQAASIYVQDTIPEFTLLGRQKELTKRLLAEQRTIALRRTAELGNNNSSGAMVR